MTERTVFCDKCGFDVTEDEIESECPYWECDGAAALKVRDTGDALGTVLGEALRRTDGVSTNAKEE